MGRISGGWNLGETVTTEVITSFFVFLERINSFVRLAVGEAWETSTAGKTDCRSEDSRGRQSLPFGWMEVGG